MVDSPSEGRELFLRLVHVTEQCLDVVLDMMWTVPRDKSVLRAVQQQKPLLLTYPSSPTAIALKELARVIDKWPRSKVANGKLEFFMKRIVHSKTENQLGVAL